MKYGYKVVYSSIMVFACILLLTNCHKENRPAIQPDDPTTFKAEDFPLHTGYQWQYLRYNNYAQYSDTLLIKIVSEEDSVNRKTWLAYIFNNNKLRDSGQFILSGNTLIYKDYDVKGIQYAWFSNFKLQFPFKTGNQWAGISFPEDTVREVGDFDTYKIQGNEYHNLYSVKRYFYTSGGYSYVQFLIISKKTGIIENDFNIHSPGVPPQNVSLQLLTCSLQ